MKREPDHKISEIFGTRHTPNLTAKAAMRLERLFPNHRNWALSRLIERQYSRHRPDITDLALIYRLLATIDQASLEMMSPEQSRRALCRQIDNWIIQDTPRPGLSLFYLSQRYVDGVRHYRVGAIGKFVESSSFIPHPIPRTEPFLELARIWPEIRRQRNGHLREIVGQYPAQPNETAYGPFAGRQYGLVRHFDEASGR